MYQITLLLTSMLVLAVVPTVSTQPSITEYSVQPDVGDEGYPSSLEADFAFFKCSLSGFDENTMAVGWSFNGQIFADASEVDGMLNLRPDVNEIFGFDTGSNLVTGFALRKLDNGGDDDVIMYLASLDLFTENWRYNGDYQCSICERKSNGRCEGELPLLVDSLLFQLNIKYFPPDDYPQIESTPPAVGVETTVSCFSLPGYPTVAVTLLEIRGTDETSVSGDLIEPEQPGELLFHNYTYIPTMEDSDMVFKCTIENTFKSGDTSNTYRNSVELEPLRVVSIPVVTLAGPETVQVNSTLEVTCTATSPTKDDLGDYEWSIEPSLPEDRYSSSGDTLTINPVQQEDGGAVISCRVVDSQGMEGSASYTFDAVPPKDTLLNDPPIALIIVGIFVGVILIIVILLALICYCNKRKQHTEQKYSNHSANVSSKQNHYPVPDHKSLNGPPTISSTVASQQNSAPLPPYHPSDYPVKEDHKSPMDEIGLDGLERYPEYERSRSHEQFYPVEERSPDFHYNTGYDEGRGNYPNGFDDMQVGDFTQPTDRQPAYGRGYDDGYSDQKDPSSYDDYSHNPPRSGYDDRPYGDEGTPYSDVYRGQYPDEIPPRSPHGDSYNDNYYPTEQPDPNQDDYPPKQLYPNQDNFPPEQPYLDQDGYNGPNDPYDDAYPRDRGDMYQKEDPNYPYDHEPFGERDQVPDGQEADYQGDPYNESYNPPIIDGRLPDGGVPSDPFYDLYDMKPAVAEFDDPQAYPSDAHTPDRFDPSYV